MMMNFDDVFNPEKQEQMADYIHARALDEHWCCTCIYCEHEDDGEWCSLRETVADGPCLLYEKE